MPNADYLEEIMDVVNSELGLALLQSYREMARSNDIAPKDYVIRLKEIIEERVSQRPNDASIGTFDN